MYLTFLLSSQDTEAKIPQTLFEDEPMQLGKVQSSTSHITYLCQLNTCRDVEDPPSPIDAAFGRFVRASVPGVREKDREDTGQQWVIGIIYDTTAQSTEDGRLPRLSPPQPSFSPDLFDQQIRHLSIMTVGTMSKRTSAKVPEEKWTITHG